MLLELEIEDRNGTKYGGGPIVTAVNFSEERKLDKAGQWSVEIPLAEPRLEYATAKRRMLARSLVGGQKTQIGGGIIDEKSVQVYGDTLELGGLNLLRELAEPSVGRLQINDGAGGPSSTALADIMAYAPDGWSLDTVNGYPATEQTVYGEFAFENVLQALITLTELTGEHFRLGDGRQVVWLGQAGDAQASGIRAIKKSGDPTALASNPNICLIESMTRREESYQLVTRLYLFGRGNGEAALTLADCTRTPPSGYAMAQNAKGWYLERTSATAEFGLIEAARTFSRIGPASNSEADIEAAANALYDAGYALLERLSLQNEAYDMTVSGLQTRLHPGQTIKVLYRQTYGSYVSIDIDDDLFILAVSSQMNERGMVTDKLTVSTVDQWAQTDAEILVGEIQEARLVRAVAQLYAGFFPITFGNLSITSVYEAVVNPKFDDRITRLKSAVLRFSTDVFEANASGASSEVVTTSTVENKTVTTNTVDSPIVTTNTVENKTVTINVATASGEQSHAHTLVVTDDPAASSGVPVYLKVAHLAANAGYTASLTTQVSTSPHTHSLSITLNPHVHAITLNSHSHAITLNPHVHAITLDSHDHTLTYDIFRNTGNYPGPIRVSINGADKTSELGGPWGSTGATVEVEVEIADIINAAGLRQAHTIEFTADGGKGILRNVEVRCWVDWQAVLVS